MRFEFLTKHRSKIFITFMLLALICAMGASFASEDANDLQISDDSVEVESQIDEGLSVDDSSQIDEKHSQSHANVDNGSNLQSDGEKLGASEDSSLGVEPGQGTFSQLATLTSNNRYLVLDKDYVRDGYYSGSYYSSGKTNYYYYIDLDKAITIDGKGHFLDGENKGPIFRLHTHERITLKNIVFKNTPGVAISSIFLHDGVVEFENCTFINTAGALSLSGQYETSTVTVKGIFKDVRFFCPTTTSTSIFSSAVNFEGSFDNVTFVNTGVAPTSSSSDKGFNAIRSTFSFKANFTNVKFSNFTGVQGGALYFERECYANFTDVDFINNNAYYGAAIYTKTPIIGSFNKVRFINNTVNVNDGGAIYAYTTLNSTFKDVEFINNTAQSSGGAIYATSLASSFDNVTFTGNGITPRTGSYQNIRGGAIYCDSFNSTFNNVRFINNSAVSSNSYSVYGGAMYAVAVLGGSFNNSVFEKNSAVSLTNKVCYGGALYMVGGSVRFENVNFTDNWALGAGGAMYYSGMTVLYLTDVNFMFNRVNSTSDNANYGGGALYLTGNRDRAIAELTRVTFLNNSARYYGGGFAYNYVVVSLKDAKFSDNFAGKRGGAIYAGYKLNLTNSNFTNNTSPVGSAIVVSDYYQVTVNIDRCNFTKNNGSVLETFYSYAYGGQLNISNSNFDLNYGNAVVSKFSSNIINCNITNNTGRALTFDVYANLQYVYKTDFRPNYLDNVICINNTAGNGSAVFNRGTRLTVSNSVFLKNNASSNYLKIDYDKFNHIIKLDYRVGNNYINAIDSDSEVSFTNVTYFDYDGILNSNDVYPVNTYNPIHSTVLIEIYDSETDLVEKFNIKSDDNGVFYYPYRTPVIHHIVASHLKDDYYTFISSQYDYAWGDFDELQNLTIHTPEGETLTLTRNYTYIIGVDSITDGILINKSMTINGNGFTINALNQSRIFKLESDNIRLVDIRFVNASGLDGSFIWGVDVNNTQIDKCVFDNFNVSSKNTDEIKGGAIYLTGNNSVISNSQFLNLMAMYGGAIYSNCSDMTIYNSKFDNCISTYGGAVFVDEGAVSNLINKSSFTNCNASYFGGAVLWNADEGIITGCDFKNNVIDKFVEIQMDSIDVNGGGAVVWFANNGIISNSNFTDNRAIVKQSSKFKDNLYGGALLIFGLNTNVSGSTFTRNFAQSGGAIAVMNMTYDAVHPRYIKNTNDLKKLGGSNSNIVECTFTDNFAQYGGAVMLKSYKNSVIKSQFYNNTAYLGGALIFEGMNGIINNSLFDNNVAHFGGAVVSGYNGTYNEKYEEEYYDYDMGRYLYRVVLVPYPRFTGDSNSIINSQFTNNFADSAGAVLWLDKNGFVGDNTVFKYNRAANSYARYNDSFARCYDEEIPQNIYESIQTNPNSGVMGIVQGLHVKDYSGALYWWGANGLMDNAEFIENYALNGGALVQEVSSVLVNSSKFIKNSAENGGAIWANNDSHIIYSNFTRNNATLGGAVYLSGSYSEIDNCQLLENNAHFGGAIYVFGEFSTLSNSELRLNKADYGSAIYFDSRGLTISSTVLLENQADSTSLFVNLTTTEYALCADVVLEGADNLMNAMYALSPNYVLNNVTYMRFEGIVNSDEFIPEITDLESGQNITVELYTYNTVVPISASNITDNKGYTRISVPLNSGRYVVLTSHKEDNYYKEINDTTVIEFELLDSFVTLNVEDIFYKQNATVNVNCLDGATGYVTLFVDGGNFSTEKLDKNHVSFNVAGLEGGEHELVAYYHGDINFASDKVNKTFNVKPIPSHISVSSDGGKYGDPISINVVAGPDEITGEVIITIENDYGESVNIDNVKSFTEIVNNLAAGKHNITVYYKGDHNYRSSSNSTEFEVTPIDLPASAYANPTRIPSNRNVTFSVDVPNDFDGKVRITVDDISRVYNVTGSTILIFNKLFMGSKTATIEFFDDKNYRALSLNSTFEIIKPSGSASGFGTVNADNMTRGYNSPYDYQAAFLDYEGNLLVNINVSFVVDGKEYKGVTNKDGIAQLTASTLAIGEYEITSINLLTGEESTRKLSIVKRLSDNRDVTVDFASGEYFSVKVWGDDGKLAPEGEFVSMSIGKNHYVARIDANGIARMKITFKPNTYTVITEYKGYKVTNKIVVKQTFKLAKKTVKVKKGKKFVLKATLKWSSGKAIKGKVIKFKFKGKTYKAKTNAKGIAKVTIKKKVAKKLKKGKKYAFTASYLSNTLKGSVKVRK